MTNLVVDSSVVIKWFVAESGSAEANCILSDYNAGDVELLAPDLLYAEVGNIIWKKQRFQGMDSSEAREIIDAFQDITLVSTPTAELLSEAFHLAVEHERTVYDAVYLALSLKESCQFVTADEKLVNALSSQIPSVVLLADWPSTATT